MSNNPAFDAERRQNIAGLKADRTLQETSIQWVVDTAKHKYTYNYSWMGRPIIQFPQDMIAMQELIWQYKPDLLIETGVAHGGSIVYYASLMELMGGNGRVLGIDIDIRSHNREALEAHPMRRRFDLIEGSSIAEETLAKVRAYAQGRSRIMVSLDSNHTHEHVLQELRLYSPFVKAGGYVVVFDTVVEYFPDNSFPDRPWGKGNSPLTAVRQFLAETDRFAVDTDIDAKLLISVAPEGYLRCIKG